MTQPYRSQLRHQLQQVRENVLLYRANLLDDIAARQNRHELQYAEVEIRQVKRQYLQTHCHKPYPPIDL